MKRWLQGWNATVNLEKIYKHDAVLLQIIKRNLTTLYHRDTVQINLSIFENDSIAFIRVTVNASLLCELQVSHNERIASIRTKSKLD